MTTATIQYTAIEHTKERKVKRIENGELALESIYDKEDCSCTLTDSELKWLKDKEPELNEKGYTVRYYD